MRVAGVAFNCRFDSGLVADPLPGLNRSIIPQMTRFCLLPMLALSVTLQAAPVGREKAADSFQERLVLGTVIAVRPERALITIRESDLLGRLRIRFKCYQVKQSFLLYGLRRGDRISAVFATKDNMLHRVRRVQSYRAFSTDPSH